MKKIFGLRSILLVLLVAFSIIFISCDGGCNKTVAYTRYQQDNTSTQTSCASSASTTEETDWMVSAINAGLSDLVTSSEYTSATVENQQIMVSNLKVNNLKKFVTYSDTEENSSYYLIEANMDKYVFLKYRTRVVSDKYIALVNAITTFDTTFDTKETTLEDLYITLNGTAGCMDTTTKKEARAAYSAMENHEDTNVYRIAALYMIDIADSLGSGNYQYTEPIAFIGGSFETVMANFWNNFFVFPVAWLINAVAGLLGGYYWIGLLLVTLFIRTAGWPIYSKSNDMSLKMGLMQPELTKIQEKYAMRQDADSQRQMQMEQAQLYKKYGVGLGGCIAPLIQFPIFIAVYQAVSRLPYTVSYAGTVYTNNWANELNSTLLGVDLFSDKYGAADGQLIGTIVLVLLVVGTQLASQLLSKALQKKQNDKKQENIPAYRRQAYKQTQNEQQQQMQLMMYMMMGMMGLFVWTSKLGLGLYWLIGNLFSMGQQIINSQTSLKKMEKLQQKQGIYTVKPEKRK